MKIALIFLVLRIQLLLAAPENTEKWDHRHRGVDTIETLDEDSSAVTEIDSEAVVATSTMPSTPQLTGLEKLDTDNVTEEANEQSKATVINCQCGFKRSGAGKIVGGTLSDDHAWPWMAALVFVGDATPRQFCGGSLINTQYILTAAHCVQDLTSVGLDKFRVYMGTNLIVTNQTSGFLQSRISSVISHPGYNSKTLNNDMALLKLTNPVTFTDTIMPICLGQKGAPHTGRTATVAGWGSLSVDTDPVNALRNVNVKVMTNPDCGVSYQKIKIRITPLMLCAALPKRDSCKGDSGGPLFSKRTSNSLYDQIGVVSFGQDCAKPDFPGVYARVGRFMKWIKDNTQDASYCTASFAKP